MRSLPSSLQWPGLFLLCNLCSRNGRGYPDISAQAIDYQFVTNGEVYHYDGTTGAVSVSHSLFPAASALRRPSSSTRLTANVQTVAGMVSLMNDFLLVNKKQTLGFLNPLLYIISEGKTDGLTEGINDIVIGANLGCDIGGFQATAGWDPVRPAALGFFPESFLCLADVVLYNRSLV